MHNAYSVCIHIYNNTTYTVQYTFNNIQHRNCLQLSNYNICKLSADIAALMSEVQFGMRVVKRPRTVFTRLIGEACMIRQQANKENVILLNARSELSLMVLPKLSLVRYQDSGQDQGAVKGEEKNEKSPEQVPEVVPFPSNNNDSNESTTKVKMKFSDIKSKRTTAKEKGGAKRSTTTNTKYKQTKISDMMTKST